MEDENIIDITDRLRKLVGEQIKYAAVGEKSENRSAMQDDLIVETKSGFILNPDWDGQVYILFSNGAEIEVRGSDYVSVFIRNDHMEN